jgi:hypothetical protein
MSHKDILILMTKFISVFSCMKIIYIIFNYSYQIFYSPILKHFGVEEKAKATKQCNQINTEKSKPNMKLATDY